MNIEIVEFYPLECDAERKTLTGTLRIKLPDIGIHLLGIFVRKNKDRWHVTIPGRKGIHHETGEEVRYPFISFEDTGRQHELITGIRKQGQKFIEKRLADAESPVIWPRRQQVPAMMVPQQSMADDEAKEMVQKRSAQPMLTRSIPVNQLRDPPRREAQSYKNVLRKSWR